VVADQSHARAIEAANDETARRRKLQAAVGITPFHEQPAAAPLLHVHRLLTSGIERIDADTDLLEIERYLSTGTHRN
jgi:hypothetical protein